jgi:uncharacterized protein YndB with AHSA1/START domain
MVLYNIKRNHIVSQLKSKPWFMPNDMKPVVGHEFQLNAGDFGKSPCKVTEVDPPTRLAFNWGKDWTLTFELKDLDGKTEVTIIHSGWDADKATEFGAPHSIVRGQMDPGWAGLHKKLGAYVEA